MWLYPIVMIAVLIGIGVWAYTIFRNYDNRFDK